MALAICALVAVVVFQMLANRRTREEREALRADLKTVLAGKLDDAPEPATDAEKARLEQLELIKLRHEVRELREALAASPNQPGIRGMVKRMMPKSAGKLPTIEDVRTEWQGMESMATNRYAEAMAKLDAAKTEHLRFLHLHDAAKMSFAVGRAEDARKFATDFMTLDDKNSRGDDARREGWAVHDGNLILGRIAVEEGRVEDAKRHLLAAGKSKGSPVLNTFGPNMGLALDLIKAGEHETVLEYFERCRSFWEMDRGRLDQWSEDVKAGRIPRFGASLIN